jgi:hypothetical protein
MQWNAEDRAKNWFGPLQARQGAKRLAKCFAEREIEQTRTVRGQASEPDGAYRGRTSAARISERATRDPRENMNKEGTRESSKRTRSGKDEMEEIDMLAANH